MQSPTFMGSFDNVSLSVAATRQSFKEQEALVYQQLAQLIKDAIWLKSYLQVITPPARFAHLVK